MKNINNLDLPRQIQEQSESSYFCATQKEGCLQITIRQIGRQYLFIEDLTYRSMRINNYRLYECLYNHYVYNQKSVRKAWLIRGETLELKFSYPKAPRTPIYLLRQQIEKNKNEQTQNLQIKYNPQNCLQQIVNKLIQKYIQKAKQKIQGHLSVNIIKFNEWYKLLSQKFQQKVQTRFSRADLEIQKLEQKLVQTNKKLMFESQKQISCLKMNVYEICQNMKQLERRLQDSSYLNQKTLYKLQDLNNEFNQKIQKDIEKFNDVGRNNQALSQKIQQVSLKLQYKIQLLKQTKNSKQQCINFAHNLKANKTQKNRNKIKTNYPYYNSYSFSEDSSIPDSSTQIRTQYKDQFDQLQSQTRVFPRLNSKFQSDIQFNFLSQGIKHELQNPILNQKFILQLLWPNDDIL